VIVNGEELTADDAMQRVRCQARRRKVFAEWPQRWDAHAPSATECGGLTATEPIERNAEFRRRFSHLFRPSTQRAVLRRLHG